MIDRDQEVIAFLSDGASYGEPSAAVTRVDTHCSIAFLLRARAYKLKRPIAFSALDYSTVERRHAACCAELELNRRAAPELYLGIRAICRRTSGAIAFDSDGEVLDWVVVMRRFDQADLLDRLVGVGRLDLGMMGQVAEEIADFHQKAERVSTLSGSQSLKHTIERNYADHITVENVLIREAIESLREASLRIFEQAADSLDRRSADGRLRRCHGDLRLANICLIDGRPTLFDSIEFSAEISCIDVLFDLAFLLEDLHLRGLDLAASHLFNRYLDRTSDDRDLAVLPLMMSIRMATQAFMLAGASQRRHDPAESRRLATGAQSNLARALSILTPCRPRLLALGGLEGSRKSGLACALAALSVAPGARLLRGEAIRRSVLDVAPNIRLDHTAFDPQVTDRVYSALTTRAIELLMGGYSVVVDADFYRKSDRDAIAAAAGAFPFVGVWLEDAPEQPRNPKDDAPEWHHIGALPAEFDPMGVARQVAEATSCRVVDESGTSAASTE